MERPDATADGSATWTLPTWAWLLGIAAMLAWHGWLTLSLFGPDPFRNLTSDEPLVSGVHAQHQFLGQRGAEGIVKRGRAVVYSLAFGAGQPKTPIFDGSRLAELFFVLSGGTYQPAAYKIGFALLCMLVPVFLLLACKTIGLGHGTSLLATILGQLIWWGPHGRAALLTGDCELYLGSLAALAHVGFLISFHRTASVTAWFGLWMTACVGWFLQPLLFPIALPVLLAYYLSVGVKHDFLTWHFALWGAELLAFGLNLPWLADWLESWWLRTPLPTAPDLLVHRTFATVWNAPLWGGSTSRLLAVAITVGGAVGVLILNQTQQRPAARLLGLASGGALVLALLGISWEPLGTVGTVALLAPALWFACIPAAHACVWLGGWLWQVGTLGRSALVTLMIGSVACFILLTETPHTLIERCLPGEAFEIGLGPRRQAVVDTLLHYTKDNARILWEDRKRPRHASRWPALLPILTGRSYIGALDPDGFIVHSSIGLIDESLEGRAIATWVDGEHWDYTDEELWDYCRRYNVRWIVAWSPAVIERFEAWPDARKVMQVVDEEVGWLFEVNRTPNFALRGHAELLEADGQYIRLANVVPHNGEVVISLHYQAGMRVSPGRVQIEPATWGDDPIGFVRLRLAVPASRVTLSWER
ncbi:MAG: hypothetical protein EXR98_11145 [Gemmataceae bacterium]|nr:hypothetical protein [Gemmataceae bacterium]